MVIKYKSKTYIALVWLAKTWLPTFGIIFAGFGLATSIQYAFIGTFVSSALIPAINLICRQAKQAADDPNWVDVDSGKQR